MAEMLRGKAAAARVVLLQKKGDVGEVAETIGSTLCAQHIDDDRIRTYFERHRRVKGTKEPGRICWEGVPP